MQSDASEPRFATRLNSFRSRPDLAPSDVDLSTSEGLIRRAGMVDGLTSLEINYPQHARGGAESIRSAADGAGLSITGVNLRFEPESFRQRALSSVDSASHARAIDVTRRAIDLARELGAPHVGLWLSQDGFDRPFECDYAAAWEQLVSGITAVADHAGSDIRVTLEPKPGDEFRRHALVPTTYSGLLLAELVNRPNFGLRFDVCHTLIAGESPANSAALCISQGKLFGVDLNDGYGTNDDGLTVGSVALPQLFELACLLRRHTYDGVYYFDTFPEHLDPVLECEENIRRWEVLLARADEFLAVNEVASEDGRLGRDWWDLLVGA